MRCPDCATSLGPLEGEPWCPKCSRGFAPDEGVWDLRPQAMGAVKANEDLIHAEQGLATWRRLLLHKRHWVAWCDTRYLPSIVTPGTRSFLEIGGGLCYASALAKARAPSSFVLATDLSPRYLRNHARRVGAFMEASADVYAAADAETLPFEDQQFDAVYSQIVLCRVPDPVRALREIWRVLAPGGTYLAVEHASPTAPPFYRREVAYMRRWSDPSGVVERAIRYRDWVGITEAAGFGADCVAPVPGQRIRGPRLRRLLNTVRPIHVTIRLRR